MLANGAIAGPNAARPAIIDYDVPGVKLDYFQSSPGSSTYNGYDRFGRVKDQFWDHTSTDVDRIAYSYDYAGNRIARDISSAIYATNDKDQAYTYDGLQRLTVSKQGTLSGTTISGTPNREQDFTLDALGNWSNFKEIAAGPTTTLDQTRTHANPANEITDITEGMGQTQWPTPTYDGAGNMVSGPQPKNLGSAYNFIYDAWNRLTQVKSGATMVAAYQYDGLGRRIVKKEYVSGSLSKTRHYYYSEKWQVLEERVDAASVPSRQFVWGTRYIDELIVRDRDADASSGTGNYGKTSSGLEERLYSINDALFNVVALTNTSGAVQQRFYYDPYGTASVLAANFSGTSDAFDWEYRYTGREYDSDTGLQLNRERYYHAPLGRWMNRDPIEYEAGDLNLYEYVGDSPVNFVDPRGLTIGIGGITVGLRPTPILVPRPVISRPVISRPVITRPLVPVTTIPDPTIPGPAAKPMPKVSEPSSGDPPHPGDGMDDPPGDCTEEEYARLRREVLIRCMKQPENTPIPVCTGNTVLWSCDDLKDAARKHTRCANARKNLDDKCFRGGNAGHRHQRDMERYHADTCWYKYNWWGCGSPCPNLNFGPETEIAMTSY